MNWLIYIGGGLIFWVIVMRLGMAEIGIQMLDAKRPLVKAYGLFLAFAPFMIWAWICWKFFR